LFIISLVVIATRPSICSLANTKEEKMGVLVFVCPTSGHEVVEIDPASYQGLKHETAEIKCSACGLSQNFFRSKHDWSDNLQIGTTKD
jgi:hypothetical protein